MYLQERESLRRKDGGAPKSWANLVGLKIQSRLERLVKANKDYIDTASRESGSEEVPVCWMLKVDRDKLQLDTENSDAAFKKL